MATSGTRDGAETVSEIVTAALEEIFQIAGGDTAEAEDAATGLRTLRRMLRSWAAQDVRLWLTENQTVTLVASTSSYTLSPRALEIYDCFRRDANGNDTPVRIYTREEFNSLPNKSASGDPYIVWMDRQTTQSVLNVYPVPSAAGSTLVATIKRPIEDVTALSEDAEIPPEWVECVIYNLAVRLAPKFGAEINPVTAGLAQNLFDTMAGQDREGSVIMRARGR